MVFDGFDGWDLDLDGSGLPDALENVADELGVDVGPGSATAVHGWEYSSDASGTPDLIEDFSDRAGVDLPLTGDWDADALNTGTPDIIEAVAEELDVELPSFIHDFNPHQ